MSSHSRQPRTRWLNPTVLGIGLASLCSDWSHETATAIMPAFLGALGVSAFWLGLIEGVADGLSSFAKMASGYYTDRLQRRKPIAVIGYLATALGTAAFAVATSAWHVLAARAFAWLGRGLRTPVRKALLAGSVTPETYGRAFGFERMMDTVGAITGPASAFLLLRLFHGTYSPVFICTLLPGLAAAAVIAFLVRERARKPVPHISFGERLRALPTGYRRFVVGVGLFGAGDFAHTLLILLATQKLAGTHGPATAASLAVGLYAFHNVLYAAFSMVSGWLADRFPKPRVLAAGYLVAAAMASLVIFAPLGLGTLAAVFALGGIYVAMEETLEDSLCAELVTHDHHGMAFGVLATVNGLGDFLSSLIVGALWSWHGTSLAFSYSAVLFLAGAILVARLNTTSENQ